MNIIFEPDHFYHIYNRDNGNELLFKNNGNYFFFLEKYQKYISLIADTYCYCLMPNHFHFLVKIKSELELFKGLEPLESSSSGSKPLESSSKLISNQFSKLFNSYAQAFNKQQKRKGSLFMSNFKRKLIDDDKYLKKVVHYIHHNPMKHGYAKSIEQWEFSSYKKIINNEHLELISKQELLSYFESLENFICCHQEPPQLSGIQ